MSYIGAKPDSFQYLSSAYDHFSGNGVTSTFTLTRAVSANGDIQVTVNNVTQDPGVAYYVQNLNQLIFTGPPSSGANNITVVYRSPVQMGVAPAANTVVSQTIAAGSIQAYHLTNSLLNPIVDTFTGDGATVNFTMSATPPAANSVAVTVNGITQNSPTNYSVSGAVLTFTSAPAINSVIRTTQQSMIGTSMVPVDGSVTTSKLGSSLTLSGTTTLSNNPVLSSGTINGITYLNASKALTSGSALTFDGTNFATTGQGSFVTDNGGLYGVQIKARPSDSVYSILKFSSNDGVTNYSRLIATSSNELRFEINGSEQMRLTSTGLGIGTSVPSQKLSVNGSGSTYLSVSSSNAGAGAGAYFTNSSRSWIIGAGAASGGSGFEFYDNTGGATRMLLDTSGNLGLGVTPSAWSLGKTLQLGDLTGASVYGNTNISIFGNNAYYGGGWKYGGTGLASRYDQDSGVHKWYTAASGTAGGVIPFTQAMTLDASGNLGIGVTNPSTRLAVSGDITLASTSNKIGLSGFTSTYYLQFQSGTTILAGGTSTSDGVLVSGSGVVRFNTNGSERMRIDVSGNVGVKTTTAATTFQVEEAGFDTTTTSVTNTSTTTIYTFASATFRTAEFIIQIVDSTNSQYHSQRAFITHDGTNVYMSQSDIVTSVSELGTIDATISGGNLNLTFTATASTTKSVKVLATMLTV